MGIPMSRHLIIFSGSLILLHAFSLTHAEPLNMTISGRASEKVELETLVPSPDIPSAEALSLSLDGGKSAVEGEVEALSPSAASLFTDSTHLPMPGFSAIPDSPYIVQSVPVELERQKNNKLKRGEPRIRFTHWEFKVVDEHNNIWHEKKGEGFPPSPLLWNGMKDDQFVLEPNRSYFSYLKLSAHGEPDRTIAGESVRFLAFIRQNGPDTVIRFGERVYQPDSSQFSEEAKLYLDDLSQRLSHLISFYKDSDSSSSWRVIIWEPSEKSSLGDARLHTWKTYLEKSLGRNMPEDRFSLESPENGESSVSIVFPRARPPLTDLALRGNAKSSLTLPIESMESLVSVKEDKDMIIVDLRHDRLFLPGSAYIRDEALPYLTYAISQIRNAMLEGSESSAYLRAPDEEARVVRREEKAHRSKKILLRSYTQKLPDDRKEQEEDPKLTAARSKILFMMFAREGLAP